MKAIVTVGVSASGKSTYAAELVKNGFTEINRDWIRFNLVKPGANWSNWKWKDEKEVDFIEGKMVMDAWSRGDNIVISNTNLNPQIRKKMIDALEDLGYDVQIVPLPITIEEAFKRDNLRANGVGEGVIYKQYQQWLDFSGRRTYTPEYHKRDCLIVDVDGTIAEMHDRGPFDWKKVGQDKPRQFVIDMVQGYRNYNDCDIVICSGRSDECFGETYQWLLDNNVFFDRLYMRKEGDYRKDNAVKEEIFWNEIVPEYNVLGAVDDRPQMIRLWHELKIPNVIAVANPYLEF